MTEAQKTAALEALEDRAVVAERGGLRFTARSWRDYAASMAVRPAAEIVICRMDWVND